MTDTEPMVEPQQIIEPNQLERLRSAAISVASHEVAPRPSRDCAFFDRIRAARQSLDMLEKSLARPVSRSTAANPRLDAYRAALQDLRAHFRLLRAALDSVSGRPRQIAGLPRILIEGRQGEPRVAAVATAYFRAVHRVFSGPGLQVFIRALQVHDALTVDELWDLPAFLKFALLESLLDQAAALGRDPESASADGISVSLKSLRSLGNADWNFLLEPLIAFDESLLQDPAGVYQRMTFEGRQIYRKRVALIASRSDCTESQVARKALDLARQGIEHASDDVRMKSRLAHVGYYLVDKGFPLLAFRTGFHPAVSWRVRHFVESNADDSYIGSIYLWTIFFIAAALFPVLPRFSSFTGLALAILALLFPAMQVAVELVNNAVTSFLDPVPLPKLDFSKGIPADCTTLVAVPCLLLNENQVHELVKDLEVRYLANRDPNLHFALLTDLPDSVSKPNESDMHPLVELAVRLIGELNAAYGARKQGDFMILHRNRIFNTRQGVWMGWERKRGKLLDLNKLLAGQFDAFPIKAGGVDALRRVRFVITLDSDTQLPRGSAARLIGAIAHPLNQAIIDPKLRIVTSGYGILQPRMGVTVRSTARSRLAAIYSGQSGFDIYSHASSDAYQDLFGEGIFTGKGIYEVATLHAVLDRRFPRNALLSHDLIEGAYARAGLATDIELVDDYPSHYSAYIRRQHRWVRGDWQIAQWMFSRVPDESGRWATNPISPISRWKIFDNIRRSLVDPFLLILFVAGWLGLPGGPLYWTIVSLLLLIFPGLAQFGFGVGRALASGQIGRFADALAGLRRSALIALLHLVFLAQQTFLAFDAIFRSLIRGLITGERLLEWETAAQAEMRTGRRSVVDRYMGAAPLLAVGLAALIFFRAAQRDAIFCAAPILLLWAISNPVTAWLNRPPRERLRIAGADKDFLMTLALRIWRYFREFGGEGHHFLIPDNVQEQGYFEAPRISPTNIGLLLNARQAACEFGFLTIPEFAALTGRSLSTIAALDKFRGHLYNWYDTQTLRPLDASPGSAPFVSSVDSGNMVASLYTLRAGAKHLAGRPLLAPELFSGLIAYWRLMRAEVRLPASVRDLRLPTASAPISAWIAWLPAARTALAEDLAENIDLPASESKSAWWQAETRIRVEAILTLLDEYLPWLLPQYEPLRAMPSIAIGREAATYSITGAISFAEALAARLDHTAVEIAGEASTAELVQRLRVSLSPAINNLRALSDSLRMIEQDSKRLAEETDFSFLVNPDRQVLSIGYDAGARRTLEACYDLVASEARLATFLAIARGDLPQQSWFKLSRDHTYARGRFILLSWTGTMFEYMMPALWMRSYPGTLIARTESACVHVQQEFAHALGLPWGISESGRASKDDAGNYQYFAFGVPDVALSIEATAGPVISPYSTFLALSVDTKGAVANLRRMESAKWAGHYGLYEAADFTRPERGPTLVREWMAHHQGMSLLAVLNLLHADTVRTRFHENALVQATERLLHEMPMSKAVLRSRLHEA